MHKRAAQRRLERNSLSLGSRGNIRAMHVCTRVCVRVHVTIVVIDCQGLPRCNGLKFSRVILPIIDDSRAAALNYTNSFIGISMWFVGVFLGIG